MSAGEDRVPLNENLYRHRAIIAMRVLLGGGAVSLVDCSQSLFGLKLKSRNVILIAGDNDRALGVDQLMPLAHREDAEVIGTYVDPSKAGHRFQFDLILRHGGERKLFAAYRLWRPKVGWPWFVPETGRGPSVEVSGERLTVTRRKPFRDEVQRMAGIARGQAEFHRLVYADSPYRTPDDHWSAY